MRVVPHLRAMCLNYHYLDIHPRKHCYGKPFVISKLSDKTSKQELAITKFIHQFTKSLRFPEDLSNGSS